MTRSGVILHQSASLSASSSWTNVMAWGGSPAGSAGRQRAESCSTLPRVIADVLTASGMDDACIRAAPLVLGTLT